MPIHRHAGRFIFRGAYRVPNRQQAEPQSQPRRPNGLLPPTERRHPRSDFPPNCNYRSPGLHPFHSSAAFPFLQTISIRHPGERFLVHGPHLQSLRSTPCYPRPAMGSRLHARFSTVQRPSEKCPASSILARGIRRMAHAYCCRLRSWSPTRVSVPLLRGTFRVCIEHQYGSWYKYHHSHRHRGVSLHLYYLRTSHLSAVAIPELILRSYLVSCPEIGWPSIQGSRF